jgi:hypothetical protein
MGESLFDTNGLIELQKANKTDISGYTTIFNILKFPKSLGFFKKIKILYPNSRDYESALILSEKLYRHGTPIPAIDILVASISYNNNLLLISRDKHFDRIKQVWKDFQFSED